MPPSLSTPPPEPADAEFPVMVAFARTSGLLWVPFSRYRPPPPPWEELAFVLFPEIVVLV
ncbi:MAG: hypothetical protein PVSMB10_16760 [Pseudarthrobacter sp.]